MPTVQINGVVWKQQIAGNKVFAGGQFSTARPAGAAAGTNEVTRNNLLAYNLDTGVLDTTFSPSLNGRVKGMALSPDGKTLYISGSFTQIDGQSRSRAAAFDVATGALLPWDPGFNSEVNSLIATNSAVFAGGQFSRVGSSDRLSLAAVSPTGSGALLAWAPTTDAVVQAIAITSDESRIVVAGNFTVINGASAGGLGAVKVSDGSSLPFAINNVIQNTGSAQSFLSLQMDANDNVYGTGYAFGGSGPFFEGVFAANAMTGAVNWLADCHGDSYDAMPMGDVVYAVSHHHYCENIGGFPDTDPRSFWQRADGFTIAPTGTVKTNGQGGYPNFAGQAAPSLVSWFPDVASGTYTGQTQGGWTLTANDKYLLMGGEFPTVNGVKQQGLVRFAVRSVATNKVGPEGNATDLAPTLFQTTATTARINIPTTWDRDDLRLTYDVYREGQTAPVATLTNDASFWEIPPLHTDVTGLSPGTYRFRVKISDPWGNAITTPYVSITMSSDVAAYPGAVINDGATHYWKLGSTAPFTDLAGNMDMTTTGTIQSSTDGAYTGSTSSVFDGSTAMASGTRTETGPQVFSVEAWFKTTTTRGGKIVGFGDSATGLSSNYDRQIYMTNNGRVEFGVYNGSTQTVVSSQAYNDGQWHQAVGMLSSSGMTFYVDGVKIGSKANVSAQNFTGRWKIGADSLGSWPDQPSSNYFAGSIDDVAVYPTALSGIQVRSHYMSTARTLNVPAAPTDAYGLAVYNDQPTLQWRFNETSGSTEVDTTGNGMTGTVSGGTTWGATSTVAPGTGITLNGVNGLVATQAQMASPNTYSTEIWFNTTTQSGGKIIGFGNQASGSSSNYDRHVYMRTTGQLMFGVWAGSAYTITSPNAYNDGQWHHVVATQGSDGMKLYVDGQQVGSLSNTTGDVYNGYWRVGGDTPWEANAYFQGKVDEAAVYDKVLTPQQVLAHYRASAAAVNIAPSAQITGSTCTYLDCSFTGTGTDPDGTVASYAWNFGDGSSATTANATHSYTTPGTYTVTFTVTDDKGATKSAQTSVTVTTPPPNQLPTASFSATKTDLSVAVDASASSDPDGTVDGYAWTFGDGSSGTGKTATHAYSAEGTYTITLTVTDNRGGQATTTQDVTVTPPPNQNPTASFTSSVNGATVSVDASASNDPDGTIASYAWAFGDGSSGTGKTATHTYAAAGTYTITLTVTDNRGGTGTKTGSATTTALIVSDDFDRTASSWGTADKGGTWTYTTPSRFSTDGQTGVITLPTATSSGTAYLNDVSAQDLDVTATIQTPTVTTGSGPQFTFIVRRVNATTYYLATYQLNPDGNLRLNISKQVSGVSTSLGDVKVSTFSYGAGDKINLRLTVTGNGATTIALKAWKDGTTEPATASMTRTDDTAALQAAGSFAITSYLPGSATQQAQIKVDNLRVKLSSVDGTPANQNPTASFTSAVTSSTVAVDASASSDPDGTIASYAWNFGDNSTGTGKTATHTYAQPGTYTVTLTVTDNSGGTATKTGSVTIAAPNQNPTASFTSAVTSSTVAVDASASSDPDGTIASYAWNFGDNSTGTGKTATHTYSNAGTYTVTLTVTDNSGGTATKTGSVTIAAVPVAETVVSDDFDRTASSWGTADKGGTWTYTTPSRFSTDGQTGVITLPTATSSGTAYLNDVSVRDLDLTTTIQLPDLPTGNGPQLTMIVRRVSATTSYRATYQMYSDGYLRLNISKQVDGVSTSLGDVKVSTFSYGAGDKINLRLTVTGNGTTTIALKAWKDGTTEPATASMTRTDDTAALQAAGSFAITSYLASNATGQVQIKMDNLRIKQA